MVPRPPPPPPARSFRGDASRVREEREEFPRGSEGATREQEPAHGHARGRDEGFAEHADERSSARVRHVRRVSSSSTLERSARGGGERRFAQREEEQEVDEEIPKFLGDEGTKRAASREVSLGARRAFHHPRDDEVHHDERAEVGEELKREPGERAFAARPRHPRRPRHARRARIRRGRERLRRFVRDAERGEGTRHEHESDGHRAVHGDGPRETRRGRRSDVLP